MALLDRCKNSVPGPMLFFQKLVLFADNLTVLIFVNSVNPDVMPHSAAVHLGLQ